jgi:hypothetical protein
MEQKDTYWEMQRKRLRKVSAKIEAIESAKGREGSTRLSNEELEALRVKLEETLKDLDALKGAGENAWEHLKTGMEKAVADVQVAAENAVSEFKKK